MLFLKKSASLFILIKRAKKERKSDLLFLRSFDLFEKSERAIRFFALFLKEQKSDSLFGALFEKSERSKRERAKERLPNPG